MSTVPASISGTRAADASFAAWRRVAAIVAALVAVFVLCWTTADSLMQLWSDTDKTTYTHGYIIAALTLWLVVRRRNELADIPVSPSIAASVLCLATGFAWLIAVRAGVEIVHQLLLLALLWLSIAAGFGWRTAVRLWIPVGYLIFAIPAWDQINFILQGATTKAVALLLAASSIPAYVDGNIVHLAAGVFEVAGGCSGIHFMIVSLALATLYGEIGHDSMKVRIRLLALAAGIALLTNWLRVYIIIVAGYLTDMQHFLIRDGHYNFGWMLFAVMMVVFFLLARRFAPAARERIALTETPTTAMSRRLGIAVAVACVAAGPAFEFLRPVTSAALPSSVAAPSRLPSGWSRSVETQSSTWNPVFTSADQIERAEYRSAGGSKVQLFVARYARQEQNKELVNYGNSLIGPEDGVIVSSGGAASGTAREIIVQTARKRAAIRYYYLVGDHRTARGIVAQLWYGLLSIRHEAVSSMVALRAECAADCDAAGALLAEFDASANAQ
jgi:exosortase A